MCMCGRPPHGKMFFGSDDNLVGAVRYRSALGCGSQLVRTTFDGGLGGHARMTTTEERLPARGIILPDVIPPVAAGYLPAFAPFVRSSNQIYVSGRLSKREGTLLIGKIGAEISLEQGKAAAREVAIELLAVLKHAAADLDRVVKIARLFVMANGARGFNEPHRVADGASELLVEALGERGVHARSAMIAADLSFGCCLEIDLIAEIRDTTI